jgi:DNA repair exonuclease SbcCD ATPase subunit
MTPVIERLYGKNFLPFREGFDVPLANQGIVLVRGDNRISKAASDNGSGKTSIVHAIAWCLWGTDLLGRKADAVACRFTEDQCLVGLVIRDAQGEWSVERTRRPASLVTTGLDVPKDSDAVVVQAAIDQRIGFGYRTFMNAAVFGQGAFERFAHADQAEQMRMLDEIQGIDFKEPRERLKKWRTQLLAQRDEIESSIATDSEILRSAREQVKTLTTLRDTYDVTKQRTVEPLRVRQLSCERSAEKLQAEIKAFDANVKLLTQARKEQDILIEREGQLSLARQAEDEAGALNDEAGMNLRRFDEQLDELLAHAQCPTCRGKVDDKPKVRERFAKDRAAWVRAAGDRTKKYRACLDASRVALEAVEAQQEVLRAIVGGTEDLGRMVMRLEERTTPRARQLLADRYAGEQAEADKLTANIAKTLAEKWDGQVALDRAEITTATATVRVARATGRMEALGKMISVADYLTEAYSDRGIRSLLVDSVADFLNERMSEHLMALTAGEATNEMSATTETKKGTVKDRISFKPSWSWGGDGEGTGSAGQDRRIDLATFAAVQDLAESRSARPFPLKVYDEPFDALDSRGKEMACAWLRAQAKTRTVLLITHSEELAGLVEPDQTWTVVHDANGARLSRG